MSPCLNFGLSKEIPPSLYKIDFGERMALSTIGDIITNGTYDGSVGGMVLHLNQYERKLLTQLPQGHLS